MPTTHSRVETHRDLRGQGTCCGPLADAFGRRRLALVAAVIFVFGAIGAAFTPDVWVLIFSRALWGTPPVRAIIE